MVQMILAVKFPCLKVRQLICLVKALLRGLKLLEALCNARPEPGGFMSFTANVKRRAADAAGVLVSLFICS